MITATRSGNTVKIRWGWGGNAKFLDACELMVDRATGTFVPLVTDTTPPPRSHPSTSIRYS